MEKPDTHLPEKKKSTQREAGRVAFRGGSYSLLISLVVLAILVVVNVFVSALPTNLTKYDISSSRRRNHLLDRPIRGGRPGDRKLAGQI